MPPKGSQKTSRGLFHQASPTPEKEEETQTQRGGLFSQPGSRAPKSQKSQAFHHQSPYKSPPRRPQAGNYLSPQADSSDEFFSDVPPGTTQERHVSTRVGRDGGVTASSSANWDRVAGQTIGASSSQFPTQRARARQDLEHSQHEDGVDDFPMDRLSTSAGGAASQRLPPIGGGNSKKTRGHGSKAAAAPPSSPERLLKSPTPQRRPKRRRDSESADPVLAEPPFKGADLDFLDRLEKQRWKQLKEEKKPVKVEIETAIRTVKVGVWKVNILSEGGAPQLETILANEEDVEYDNKGVAALKIPPQHLHLARAEAEERQRDAYRIDGTLVGTGLPVQVDGFRGENDYLVTANNVAFFLVFNFNSITVLSFDFDFIPFPSIAHHAIFIAILRYHPTTA